MHRRQKRAQIERDQQRGPKQRLSADPTWLVGEAKTRKKQRQGNCLLKAADFEFNFDGCTSSLEVDAFRQGLQDVSDNSFKHLSSIRRHTLVLEWLCLLQPIQETMKTCLLRTSSNTPCYVSLCSEKNTNSETELQ